MKQKKNQEVHSQVIKLKRFFLTVKYFFQLKRREIYWIITSDVADSLKTIFKYVTVIVVTNLIILLFGITEFYTLSFFNLQFLDYCGFIKPCSSGNRETLVTVFVIYGMSTFFLFAFLIPALGFIYNTISRFVNWIKCNWYHASSRAISELKDD